VSGRCNCCRRPWDVCFPSTQSSSPSEFVCHDCKPHQGFTLRSDPEHIKLWQAYLAAREREHDGAVSQLNEWIADLERELSERPEKIVERWHGTDEIEAARAEAYADMVARGSRYLAAQIAKGIAAERVAATIVKAAKQPNPRLRYIVPNSARPLIALLTSLPGRLADRAKQRALAAA